MENNRIATFNIENKYLADGLAFCGYHFQKYTTEEGKIIYTFLRNEAFMDCFNKIIETKKLYGQNFSFDK